MPQAEDILIRIPLVKTRLASSVSGYVLVRRFAHRDRAALRVLIERGEAEIFESPLGNAYRLKKGKDNVPRKPGVGRQATRVLKMTSRLLRVALDIEDLATEFEVTPRQVWRDLEVIESAGFPICRHGHQVRLRRTPNGVI